MALLHWYISVWMQKSLCVCKLEQPPSTHSVWAQGENTACHPILLCWSCFTLSIGFNSHFKSFMGPDDPLFSFLSSWYCCIPVTRHHILERLFLCYSPLYHLPRNQKYQTKIIYSLMLNNMLLFVCNFSKYFASIYFLKWKITLLWIVTWYWKTEGNLRHSKILDFRNTI